MGESDASAKFGVSEVATYLGKCDKDTKGILPELPKCLNEMKMAKKMFKAETLLLDVKKCLSKQRPNKNKKNNTK